jgi:hypothetical protein
MEIYIYIYENKRDVLKILSQHIIWITFTITGGKTGEEFVMQEILRF